MHRRVECLSFVVMAKINRNNLSILLMSGSLLLLLLFQLFWLSKVYEDEQEALAKETNFIFTNAVREVEDSFLNKLVFEPLIQSSADSGQFAFKTIRNNLTTHSDDSSVSKQITIRSINRNASVDMDSSLSIAIKKRLEPSFGEELSGTISLFIEMTDDDSLFSELSPQFKRFQGAGEDDTLLVALLDTKVSKGIEAANIGLNYEIKKIESTDSITAHVWHSNSYKDLFSETNYAVQYQNHRPYILKKILPHILFSIFLFSCIALAFFMVYQSLQKQRRLTQLKNDFISNVTHELKTPITTVGVAIEALSNFNALNDPARTKEYLQISKYELDRLSLLVDKVLKMSLFEKKEPELKLEVFDIKALVSEVLNSMKIQFEKRSAEVDFDTRGQDFSIEADRIHLTSVIFNLIDNALKYSQDSPKLQVAISQEAESLQISVADKGIGIAPEFLDKIFEKFFRISSGDQHNTKGYGLGLSYVASVVKKHHGNIAVNSQPQEGTKFTITLPKKHEEN